MGSNLLPPIAPLEQVEPEVLARAAEVEKKTLFDVKRREGLTDEEGRALR